MNNKYWLIEALKPRFDHIREKYQNLNIFYRIIVWILGILIIGFFLIIGYVSMYYQY